MIQAFRWNLYTFYEKVLYIKLRLDGPLLNAEVIDPNREKALENKDLICEPSGYVKDCVGYDITDDRLPFITVGSRWKDREGIYRDIVVKAVVVKQNVPMVLYESDTGLEYNISCSALLDSTFFNENTSQL
jgi:hypothetical protein